MAVCEIFCVGTELLLGDILNTNEQFLSKELAAMGISVMHRSSVGDNPERLAQELKTALGRSDIVITSGGLGPTDDDLTKEVCCEVMGFELREDEDTAERIRSYFKSKGGNMPDKTVYSLTDKGKQEFLKTLRQSILSFDYDTNIFSIAAFFIDALDDPQSLLSQRLMLLNNYLKGIDLQIATIKGDIPSIAEANIERAKFIVEAEIAGTESLIRAVSQ